MEHNIEILLSSNSFYLLTLMAAACLFFMMAAIRELRNDCYEGIIYVPLSLFFGAVHIFSLKYFPMDGPLEYLISGMNIWNWMAMFLAPALIMLFIFLGLLNLARIDLTTAMVKVFFGLTLLFFLFEVGYAWPVDVKGIITMLYCLTWFEVELETAR